MKILRNWDKFQEKDLTDTIAYRNVQEDQQVERTKIQPKKSKTSWTIAAAVLTVFVTLFTWFLLSLMEFMGALFSRQISLNIVGGPDFSSLGVYLGRFTSVKVFLTFGISLIFFAFIYALFMRKWKAQNTMNDTSDINQNQNDQHIAYTEEVQKKFDWFPDVGATSDVQFSSMISHVALSNKGLKKIQVAKRAKEEILDEDGEVILYKGEVLHDDDGNVLYDTKPLIDNRFMADLYEASNLPDKGDLRKYYDATQIPYNADGKDRDKLGKFATVADLINKDWEFPYYEPQRPAGAYLVDTAPVNTMVKHMFDFFQARTYPTLLVW